MSRFWRIIAVLTWKNLLLMRRKPSVQFLIFASPIILFGLFGGELKPLVNNMQKWSCVRPLDNDGQTCEWAPFTPIINNSGMDSSMFAFGMSDQGLNPKDNPNWHENITMGCAQPELQLYVVNAEAAGRRSLVHNAVFYLTTVFQDLSNEGYGLPWTIVPHFVDADEITKAYTSMAATNMSHLGGSGCFFGIEFEDGDSDSDLRLRFRPPYVPGGFRNSVSWDESTGSMSPRTWHTKDTMPGTSPIVISNPRTSDLYQYWFGSVDQVGDSPGYAFNVFLALQHAFAVTFSDEKNSAVAEKLRALTLNRLPYPEYNTDPWAIILLSAAPWAIFLPLMFASSQLVRDMVQEKQDKIKAAMKMMGVTGIHHWTAWFFRGLLSIGLALVVVTFVSVGLKLFPVDGSILLIFFLLAGISIIAQTFVVSTLFNKATNAAFCAGFGTYLTLLPFLYGVSQQAVSGQPIPISNPHDQMTVCLLPGSCIGLGFYSIANIVVIEGHVTWSNLMDAPGPQSLAFGQVLLMLFIDVIYLFAVAAYIDLVFPGDFGVPLHPLFPLVWIKEAMLGRPQHDSDIQFDDAEKSEYISPPDEEAVIGLSTENLTKVFPARKSGGEPVIAVNHVSLPMVKGQITCLLGENGAGKTTTMSMLCGLFPPTDGTMHVEGRDVISNQNYMHEQLGVCPQHDVLWPTLTVEEHLYLFGRLKSIPPEQLETACKTMIHDLGLNEKAYAQTKTLSGGQKRRLSCGIALIGGSTVVLLDEPSSGCDPKARRDIWELLLRHKEGRTILLSTHFMDEADVLGDRVAVMAGGKLVATGTPSFLKDKFGTGYTLTVSKKPTCETANVAALVQKHVPNSDVKTDIGTELSIRVPKEATKLFPELLRDLDTNKDPLGVDAFGVTITTMEEVFLAASQLSVSTSIPQRAVSRSSGNRVYEDSDYEDDSLLPLHGKTPVEVERSKLQPTITGQLAALTWKRKLKIFSEPIFTSAQVIVPILLLCIRLVVPSDSAVGSDTTRALNPTAVLYDSEKIVAWGGTASTAYLQSRGGSVDTDGMDIDNYVGNYSKGAFAFNRMVQTGVSVDPESDSLTAWFNAQYYHSVPEAHLLAVNLLFRTNMSASSAVPRMSVEIDPMPITALEESTGGSTSIGDSLAFAMSILFALNAFGCMTVYGPIDEQASKHIQHVSGVSYRVYWLAYWLSDYAISMIVTLAAMLTSAVGHDKVYADDAAGAAVALFVTFFVSYLCCLYFVSLMFTTPSNGVRFVLFFQLFFGLIPIIVTPIVRLIGYAHTADTITNAFLWLPVFSVSQGLSWIGSNYAGQQKAMKIMQRMAGVSEGGCHSLQDCCDQFKGPGFSCTTDYFAWDYPGAGRFVLAHVLQAVGYILLLAIWEEKLADRIANVVKRFLFASRYRPVHVESDQDVEAEARRVERGEADDSDVLVQNVRKAFKLGSVKAVNGVSLGIPSGQCFGLLGVNGAGKTTLFKALTGDHLVDTGSVKVAGYDVRTDLTSVQSRIGYVPQFDALLGYMTGRDLLSFYAQVKGVTKSNIPQTVEHLIEKLNLKKHAGKPCATYSGGNKRKLSVAAALVGGPGIILLDEPTTGMDPGSRRFLWNVILDLVQDGRSVVLTTHSMEEAEALTQRLCIMVKGRMQCLGSPQHLKNRFGSGYIIRVVAGEPERGAAPLSAIQANLQNRFPSLVVDGVHKSTLSAKIEGSVVLADLFAALEDMKDQMGLADYSASQTSLEQIFLRYARDDDEEETFTPTVTVGGPPPQVGAYHGTPALPPGARFDPRTGQPLSVQSEA